MADEGLLIPIQFTLEEARAALNELEARARAAGQRAGEGVSGGMGKGLAGIKGQLGPARESMMFFTSALGEFGPAGQKAQTALTGIGGALMSATPMLAGAALGMAAFRLATGAVSDSMDEAEAKARKTTTALEGLAAASRAVFLAEAGRLAQAQGVGSFDLAQRLLAVTREEAAAKKDLAEATWVWQSNAAQQRLDEARATRAQILLDEKRTAGLRGQNAAIQAGIAAQAAAWAMQEQEAARLTALEEKRKAERDQRQREQDARNKAALLAGETAWLDERDRLWLEHERIMAGLSTPEAKAAEQQRFWAADLAIVQRAAAARFAIEEQSRAEIQRMTDEANREALSSEEKTALARTAIERETAEKIKQMREGALRELAQGFVKQFGPILEGSRAYNQAMKEAGGRAQNTADLSIAAFAAMTQGVLSSLAQRAAIESLWEVGQGIAAYARYDPYSGGQHMAAAATYAAVAGIAGAGAIAIGQTRGMTAAERDSVNAVTNGSAGDLGGTTGGGREYGGGTGSGGSSDPITVRETIYIVSGSEFETPAETARRAARTLDLVKKLDLQRRAS